MNASGTEDAMIRQINDPMIVKTTAPNKPVSKNR